MVIKVKSILMRSDGRRADELRPVTIIRDFLEYPEGSCLISFGRTKVICTASVIENVPNWLKGKGQGWITAEYSMLPRATQQRNIRESVSGRIGGRTHEIQRMIGRAMRTAVDLKKLGERTIWVDCDVIQADGGTRTAAITGAFVAVADALIRLKKEGVIEENPIKDFVAAVSVGLVNNQILLDLNFEEDSAAQVDMNVVGTGTGMFSEVHTMGEENVFTKEQLIEMLDLARKGIDELIDLQSKLYVIDRETGEWERSELKEVSSQK